MKEQKTFPSIAMILLGQVSRLWIRVTAYPGCWDGELEETFDFTWNSEEVG